MYAKAQQSEDSRHIIMHYQEFQGLSFEKDFITTEGVTYKFHFDGNPIVRYTVGMPTKLIIPGGHFEVVGSDEDMSNVAIREKFVSSRQVSTSSMSQNPEEILFHCDNLEIYFDNSENLTSGGEYKVTHIAAASFTSPNLRTVTLPQYISTIAVGAFSQAVNLANVVSLAEQPADIPSGTFSWETFILVPAGSTTVYQTAQGWKYSYLVEQANPDVPLTDGTIFGYLTPEQIIIKLKVLSASEKTCQTGTSNWNSSSGSSWNNCISARNFGNFSIPEEIDGFRVTCIGGSSFYGCSQLTSISIPNTIEFIGSYSFDDCEKLQSITIPNSVQAIGNGAFGGCCSLSSISIPGSVTKIGYWPLIRCASLESISVDPENNFYDSRNDCNAIMCTATNGLIAGCRNTSIPLTTERIEAAAFCGCKGLTNIFIPASVNFFGLQVFAECTDLESIIVNEENPLLDSRDNCNAVIDKDNRLLSGCKKTIIPSSVTEICACAFQGITGLTSVTIPQQVNKIGNQAFAGCSDLEKVVSLIINPFEISDNAFSQTTNLGGITPLDATLYVPKGTKAVYEATAGWNKFPRIEEIEEGELQDGDTFTYVVDGIGMKFRVLSAAEKTCQVGGAFEYWDANKETGNAIDNTTTGIVKIPEIVNGFTVTKIGIYAFGMCQNLESVEIPSTVNTIEYSAFSSCSNLSTITIPSSVTTIERYSFDGCRNVKTLYIPASVTYIGNGAFSINNLETITVDSENPVFDSRNNCNAIMETATNTLVAACQNTIIPEETATIKIAAFYGCGGLTHVRIPAHVTEVDNKGLFGLCNDLVSIEVDEANPYFDSRDNCNALIESTSNTLISGCAYTVIPSTVTAIADYAFYALETLETINIPASVNYFGNSVFDWGGLQSITLFAEQPAAATSNTFWGVDTHSVILYVPVGTKAKYEEAEGWKEFSNIVENVGTAISDIPQNKPANPNYYDLQGRSSNNAHGIHVIRNNDGSVRKVVK